MRVQWTATAVGHLESIHEYVAQTSPYYADLLRARIMGRVVQISAFPESGRTVPERERPDIREVIEPPYRIIYRVTTEVAFVLAVIHSRRADLGPLL